MRRLFSSLVLLLWTSCTVFAGEHCFTADTPVLLADGQQVPISKVKVGDRLRAFDQRGRIQTARVEEILERKAAGYFEIETEEGSVVRATGEHPFFVGDSRFRTVRRLREGDLLYRLRSWLRTERIARITYHEGEVQVFNLQATLPHTFFAAGFAVHNKSQTKDERSP
jgi:hypothetical protein